MAPTISPCQPDLPNGRHIPQEHLVAEDEVSAKLASQKDFGSAMFLIDISSCSTSASQIRSAVPDIAAERAQHLSLHNRRVLS